MKYGSEERKDERQKFVECQESAVDVDLMKEVSHGAWILFNHSVWNIYIVFSWIYYLP